MLESLFSPKSIAVIGASGSDGKVGYSVMVNLVESGFKGQIYPINPKGGEILGLKAYSSIKDVPGDVDLALLVIPPKFILEAAQECGEKGVGALIVISAGFRETGKEGRAHEDKLLEIVRKYNMRMVGPNVLGVINTQVPYNLTFAQGTPRTGNIAFMSQSGALCISVLDIALARDIGFSQFVSLGNKADLGEIEFLQAWAEDPTTRVIMSYIEGISDGHQFIDLARKVTKKKPVIAIKSGTTSAGSRAVSSHTGTLAGSERAYEAAFKQAGIIRAGSVGDLFDLTMAFSNQPLPANDQVAIITNAGGPGIMATDAIEKLGMKVAEFTDETKKRLREVLPATAAVNNPVDVIGDALADRYRAAIDIVTEDPNVGLLLVILTPQFMTQIEETAKAVCHAADNGDMPVIACFMGEASTKEGIHILAEHNVPNYVVPDDAVAAIKAMVDQRKWQDQPLPKFEHFDVDKAKVAEIFKRVKDSGRSQIGDAEARDILDAYQIPQPASELCKTADEAVAFADKIGYPVVMKITSPDILHKTDVGGVAVGLKDAAEVREAFDAMIKRAKAARPEADIWGCLVQQMLKGGKEIILGMNRDPQFGPLVMFGLGGIYVEVLKDVAFRVAPFSRHEALDMMKEIRSYKLLTGVRGQAASDVDAIADTLLKLSQLVTDFPEILEMDINPLMVFDEGKGVMGIDMRLVLA
jgi:acetate---CoA ligase (ADP-forming)